MIKIVIEMIRESNLTKLPALRMIIFESEEMPGPQSRSLWAVKDVIEWNATQYEAMEKRLGEILSPDSFNDPCESVTVSPQGPNVGRITIMSDLTYVSAGEPTEPFIYPVLKAAYKEWQRQMMINPIKGETEEVA